MKILYVKRNDEYCRLYQLQTKIVESNGKKYSVKSPLVPEAYPHLKQMYDAQDSLKKYYSNLKIVSADLKGNELWFDFINGQPLSKSFFEVLSKKDSKELFEQIKKYLHAIKGTPENRCSFTMTPEFTYYFGEVNGLEGVPALCMAPMDITCNNLLVKGDELYFIDYEWCFSFPVPIDFMIVRCLNHLYGLYEEFEQVLPIRQLLIELNLEMELSDIEKMWKHFYQMLLHGDAAEKSYFDIIQPYEKKCLDYTTMTEHMAQELKQVNEYTASFKRLTEEGYAKKDAYIDELETGIKNLQQQMDEGFKAKDSYIDELLSQVNGLTQQIQNGFKEKDEYIHRLEDDVNYIQSQMEDGFREKDSYIHSLENESKSIQHQMENGFQLKDKYIQTMERDLEYIQNQMQEGFRLKDEYIKELEERTKNLNAQITQELVMKASEISELNSVRESLQLQLNKALNELSVTEESLKIIEYSEKKLGRELETIKSSAIWKATKRFYKNL